MRSSRGGCRPRPSLQNFLSTPAPRAASNVTESFTNFGATSRHGLAMQSYTAKFAGTNLTSQNKDVVIGNKRYRADIGPKGGWVLETGPQGQKKKYPMLYALGGKDVYYFLTPLTRGRLQTLPVAYDVRTKRWFDTAASGLLRQALKIQDLPAKDRRRVAASLQKLSNLERQD